MTWLKFIEYALPWPLRRSDKKLMCIFSFTEISAGKFSYQQKKKLGGLCTETMTT